MRIRRRCFVNSSKTTRGSQKRQPRATGSTASWPMGRSIPKRNRAHRCKRASSASIKQLASDRHDSHLASSLFFFILLHRLSIRFFVCYPLSSGALVTEGRLLASAPTATLRDLSDHLLGPR